MSDEIDKGQEADQFFLEVAMANARAEKTLAFIGRCYNCECRLSHGNFCDQDCRDDYEKREKSGRQAACY